MSGSHDAEPLVARALGLRDFSTHAVDEDLGAAAGNRIETSGVKAREDLTHGERLELREVQDLLGGERVQPERELGLHPAEEIFVPRDRKIGIEAALEEDLHSAGVDDLLQLGSKLLARQHVPFGMADGAIERAEAAARRAHVGVVHVAVDDVRDDVVRMLASSHGIRREPELEEARVGEEPLAFGGAQALAIRGARQNPIERGIWRSRRDHFALVIEETHGRFRQELRTRGLVVETLEASALVVPEIVADGVAQVRAQRRG